MNMDFFKFCIKIDEVYKRLSNIGWIKLKGVIASFALNEPNSNPERIDRSALCSLALEKVKQ